MDSSKPSQRGQGVLESTAGPQFYNRARKVSLEGNFGVKPYREATERRTRAKTLR